MARMTLMSTFVSSRRWLIGAALLLTACSQGDPSGMASPSRTAANGGDTAFVGTQAVGDVKVGTGTLDMVRLRMDRQSSPGVSVFRQYANPGIAYRIEVGETIELWAEYEGATNPRFIVNWGDGTDDFTGCGSCLLTHKYTRRGVFTVTAALDDRSGTRVTRSFTLNTDLACVPPAVSAASLVYPFSSFEGTSVFLEVCDASSANASPLFTGTDLQYSLTPGACPKSGDVSALGECSISINPSTGALSWTCFPERCLGITASNSCGSVTRGLIMRCEED